MTRLTRGRTIHIEPFDSTEWGRCWEFVRVEVDGERVSWMRTFEVEHRLRDVEITSLGVVGVHTADEHQNRGHMRFMLESALERSRERGILLSTLYGVPSLYQRWAYASVMPEFVTTISTRQAELVRRNHRVRSADRSDWPAMARLFNRETASLSGSRVRDADRWTGPRQGAMWSGTKTWSVVATDARGRVVGYCTCDDGDGLGVRSRDLNLTYEVTVGDAQAVSSRVASSLISAIAREAVRRRVDKISFHVPPQSRIGSYLRNYDVSVTSTRPVDRAQMVRLTDPGGVLKKLEPYVQQQVSGLSSRRPSRLVIRTELGDGEMVLGGRGSSRQLRLPAARLAELIFGYRTAHELRMIHGVRIARDDAEILDVLFPPMDAYCYWPDRY